MIKTAILILIPIVLFVGACDTKSSVSFKGERQEIQQGKKKPYSAIAGSQGGVAPYRTSGGYLVSASLGTTTGGTIKSQTTSGYEVRLNFQGQTSQ